MRNEQEIVEELRRIFVEYDWGRGVSGISALYLGMNWGYVCGLLFALGYMQK